MKRAHEGAAVVEVGAAADIPGVHTGNGAFRAPETRNGQRGIPLPPNSRIPEQAKKGVRPITGSVLGTEKTV